MRSLFATAILFFSLSSFAGSVSNVVKATHARSAGKLIKIYTGGTVTQADGHDEVVDVYQGNDIQIEVANKVCDLNKNMNILDSVIYCIAK